MLTEAETQAIAEKVLRQKFGPFGFAEVAVHAGLNHDGEQAFFVDAIFQRNAPSLATRASTEALNALRAALLERNEQRFPYLSLCYPDDERPEDAPYQTITMPHG